MPRSLALALLALAASGPLAAQTILVDTDADNQTYDATQSLTDCTDGAADGDCTLREAIQVANANASLDAIQFNVTDAFGRDPSTGVVTIQPASALPTITDAGIVVDGYTQPGASPNTLAVGTDAVLQIVINGQNASGATGLSINGTGITIRGLVINGFRDGMAVRGSGTVVAGTYIGTNAAGTAAVANTASGIYLPSSSTNARIGTNGDGVDDAAERNVISGNGSYGMYAFYANGTVVAGNYVGTNAAGTAAVGNASGIRIDNAPGARVGTNGDGQNDAIERNVVSGNSSKGIEVTASGASGTIVAGNYVGIDAAGATAVGNGYAGIWVENAANVRIGTNGDGTADAAERNVSSANGTYGVEIRPGSSGAMIAGNYLGTNAAGTAALGNGYAGVRVDGAANARIGTNGDGTADIAERNVVSGNRTNGIEVAGSGATGAVVAGNYVGIDAAGTAALGNNYAGLRVDVATGAWIGTNGDGVADAEERNVISGNQRDGLVVNQAPEAVVAGNYIGTDATGTAALANAYSGIYVETASTIRIGTNGDGQNDEAERNVISGNQGNGLTVSQTSGAIAGNYIGVDVAGNAALANQSSGVYASGTTSLRIGTAGDGVGDAAERNVISGNGSYGITFANGSGAVVAGNYVGTNAAGTAAIANGNAGVSISAVSGARIGTNGDGVGDVAERNVISGNSGDGVAVSNASDAVVAGNYIGVDAAGTAALANTSSGIYSPGATGLRIGTNGDGQNDAAERNVISGNGQRGIILVGGSGTVVAGNSVGVDATGAALGNAISGIYIQDTEGVRVGTNADETADEAEANRIAGNGTRGIYVLGTATATLLGNSIVGNGGIGIDLEGGTQIGGNVTLNDADDADEGPNGLQNFPVLTAGSPDADGVVDVAFTLDSTPNTTFRIELFASDAADGPGYGEGDRLLATTTVTTDGAGDAAGTFAALALSDGAALAATATPVDGASATGFGGTSEFSATLTVPPTFTATLTGAEGWRMLAAPVSGLTTGELFDPIWTQGFPGADVEVGTPSVYRYDESQPGDQNQGYATPVSAAEAVPRGTGRIVYVFEDPDYDGPAAPGFPQTLYVSGTPDASAFEFAVTYTDHGTPAGDGWNLLGNPYEVSLNWDDAGWTQTNVDDAIYIYDPAYGGSGGYRTWAGEAGPLGSGVIAPFQGFWSKATAPDPVLVAPPSARTNGGTFYGRTASHGSEDTSDAELAQLHLRVDGAIGGAARWSEAFVALGRGDLGKDSRDAYALAPMAAASVSLFSVIEEPTGPSALAVQALPALDAMGGAAEVALDLTVVGATDATDWTLTWPALDVPAGWQLTLVDTETNAEIDLRTETAYTFAVAAPASGRTGHTTGAPTLQRIEPRASDTARRAGEPESRFLLRIAGSPTADDAPAASAAFALDVPRPNPARGAVRLGYGLAEAGPVRLAVYDVLGREVATVDEGTRSAGRHEAVLDASSLPAGLYVIRLVAGARSVVRSLTIVR